MLRFASTAIAVVVLIGMSTLSAGATAPNRNASERHTPIATAARTLNISETAQLHLISHHREVLVEEGHGSGTLNGRVVVHLTLAYAHAAVTFTAYPSSGGSISGRGEGSTYAQGSIAHFNGTARVTGGTGKYAHASSSNVRINATLRKKTFALSLQLTATLRY